MLGYFLEIVHCIYLSKVTIFLNFVGFCLSNVRLDSSNYQKIINTKKGKILLNKEIACKFH